MIVFENIILLLLNIKADVLNEIYYNIIVGNDNFFCYL